MSEKTRTEKGVVEEMLPQGLFRVRLDDGQIINASKSLSFKRINIHIVPGMQVLIERYAINPSRGKIIDQLK